MAAFQWPVSKTELINSALSQTGDNLVAVADDGSDEWNCASPAYERALAYMFESHDWMSGTEVRTLQPTGDVPGDTNFDTAFALPADLVHLILVMVDDRPAAWDLLNNQIVVYAQGGVVTVKGIFSTNSDPTTATPTFVMALQAFVMSGIYRGLHKDPGEADRLWQAAEHILAQAKSRHDMQKPKRALFRSRMTAARRGRRPWGGSADRSDGW
jgi:hypothetical protein